MAVERAEVMPAGAADEVVNREQASREWRIEVLDDGMMRKNEKQRQFPSATGVAKIALECRRFLRRLGAGVTVCFNDGLDARFARRLIQTQRQFEGFISGRVMPAKVNLQDDRVFLPATGQHLVKIMARIQPAESDEAQTVLCRQRPDALRRLANDAVKARFDNGGYFLR
jgi:hypothetical protein